MAAPEAGPGETIEADFVVVGAGSAGCVLAARLSEDPSCRVVLLEAGGADTNRWIHIPLGFGKTFADPSVSWCYETEPEPGAGGRKIFWPSNDDFNGARQEGVGYHQTTTRNGRRCSTAVAYLHPAMSGRICA